MATNDLFGTAHGRTLGEIVSWGIPAKTRVNFAAVKSGLAAAGLEEGVARDMLPRNALRLALKELLGADKKIVRKVSEDAGTVRLQFTSEYRDAAADRLAYNFEAILTLDKVTGVVTSREDAALADQLQRLIDARMGYRTVADLNRIIQKLFERSADLFPVRDAGGVYFVPAAFIPFVTRVDQFIAAIGANIRRFPVPAGTAHGDRSVAESVQDGLERAVGLHVKAIEEFDDTARDSTLEKMAERIATTRFKLEAYADFLKERAGDIEDALADARQKLRDKIEQLGRRVKVDEPGEQDALLADVAAVA